MTEPISFLCPTCHFNFHVEKIKAPSKCPACNLIESIDDHISSVLRNIIINYYADYTFEIDDKSKLRNNILGFSPRQNRKHNLIIIDQAKEIHFKNFYMLLSSHIEAAFYDIELLINKQMSSEEAFRFGINAGSNSQSGYLYSLHKNNKLVVNARFKKATALVRHMANVIKHNAGIVKKDSQSGGFLIKKYKFKDSVSLYDHNNLIIIKEGGHNSFKISDYYYLTCSVYIYLKDVAAYLLSSSRLKERKLDIVKITNNLVDFQVRKSVSELLLQELQNDCLLIFPDAFIVKCDNDTIFKYIANKIKLLCELKKSSSKNVIDFEVLGEMNSNTKKALSLFQKLSHMGLSKINSARSIKITKSELNEYHRLIEKIYKQLIDIYGEDFVGRALFNDFDQLNKSNLSEFILDFYRLIYKENKKSVALIIKVIGITPFQRWNPFLFGINRPNF